MEVSEELFKPLAVLSPKAPDQNESSPETREGIIIHKLLEILSVSSTHTDQQLLNRISLETQHECSLDELRLFKQEVLHCMDNSLIKNVFELDQNQQAYNEFAIATTEKQHNIHIIDRLIVSEQLAWIIDFKTQANVRDDNAMEQAELHRAQLKRYKAAVKSLYPDLQIRCSIVFTKLPVLVDLEI
ncbi:MAG: PD-(D/E)XK nuclease family protein, partial [Pseudomonadota bacterium]